MAGRRSPSRTLLAADVGGTKTVLAVFDAGMPRLPIATRTLASHQIRDLADDVAAFLSEVPGARQIESATFAVAGPVFNGSAQLTNLPWHVEGSALRDRLGIARVEVLNDVEALAWSVPCLGDDELQRLGPAAARGGVRAVLALGTGLGEACIAQGRDGLVALPSEGSHADFSSQNELQDRLLLQLRQHHDHVSVERTCSGLALPHLFGFLRDGESQGHGEAPESHGCELPATPEIVDAALSGRSPLAVAAVELLTDILAAECGNAALRWLATGGVYLGGGLPPRLLPFLTSPRFRRVFEAKGRFSSLLASIPLFVILSPDAVLRGAAWRNANLP
ncbi:MAG: glucokinase [Candidatus Bipolaricaulota bacterium]